MAHLTMEKGLQRIIKLPLRGNLVCSPCRQFLNSTESVSVNRQNSAFETGGAEVQTHVASWMRCRPAVRSAEVVGRGVPTLSVCRIQIGAVGTPRPTFGKDSESNRVSK